MSNLAKEREPVPIGYVVEYRPFVGDIREIRVTGEQLHGRTCIVGPGCTGSILVDAGHVYTTASTGQRVYGWPVAAHPECLRGSHER